MYQSFCEVEKDFPYPVWEWFIEQVEVVLLEKDEFLDAPNHLSTHSYFIIEGLVVGYWEVKKNILVHYIRSANELECGLGRHHIEIKKNGIIEREVCVAVEDTIAIRILHTDLIQLCKQFPEFSKRMWAHKLHHMRMITELDGIFLIPTIERYRKLQAVNPFDLKRVPDVYLASYLDVTVEDLKEVVNV